MDRNFSWEMNKRKLLLLTLFQCGGLDGGRVSVQPEPADNFLLCSPETGQKWEIRLHMSPQEFLSRFPPLEQFAGFSDTNLPLR